MIEAVLRAEFDVESGQIVRMQYPAPLVGIDQEDLASSMLPDGAHNRNLEITYFMIRRNNTDSTEEFLKGERSQQPDLHLAPSFLT